MAMMVALQKRNNNLTVFEVENEEKEPGFPDTLELLVSGLKDDKKHRFTGSLVDCPLATLAEYKVSDTLGFIDFKRSQPHFYKLYSHLQIVIRAWCVPEQRGYEYRPADVLKALLRRADAGKNPLCVSIMKGGLS